MLFFRFYTFICVVVALLHLLCPLTNASAQVSAGGQPISFNSFLQAQLNKNTSLPIIATNPTTINWGQIAAKDAINDLDPTKPYRFGVPLSANIDVLQKGLWQTLPNGDKICRLAINSAAAQAIHLIYKQFYLPPGATLHLYSPNQQQILGAFTPLNNKPHGRMATGIIFGETTILEYYEPAAYAGQGQIQVATVVHHYRGFANAQFNLDNKRQSPSLQEEEEEQQQSKSEEGFGDSGLCNINVNCPEGDDWQNPKRSVGLILSQQGTRLCTGALINNARNDCTPLFLTANHCVDYPTEPETWLFMFNYESPDCNNNDGPTNQTVSGATLLANSFASDFALLEMSEPIPPDYNVWFSGWDNANTPVAICACIHHPKGDIKKISLNDDLLTESSGGSGVPNSHWRIDGWDAGTTEGGSSGSPLYNQTGLIIGQLYGGNASCTKIDYDDFGKLSMSWAKGADSKARLKDWLDPDNTGVTSIDGKDCSQPPFALDVALMSIEDLPEFACSDSPLNPKIKIRNKGSTPITSLEIKLSINGQTPLLFTWSGSLNYYQIDYIDLPLPALEPGVHNLEITLFNPNNNPDENGANNTIITKLNLVPSNSYVTVYLTTDAYGSETSFDIKDTNNKTMYAQAGFADKQQNYMFNYCLPVGCYIFTIYDALSDGICCEFGNGNYKLIDAEQNLLGEGAEFKGSASISFCVEGSGELVPTFTASDSIVCPNDTVYYSCNYPEDADTYYWAIDGAVPATASGKNIAVVYPQAGQYSVNLLVVKGEGAGQANLPAAITVLSAPVVTIESQLPTTPVATDGSLTAVAIGVEPLQYNWSLPGAPNQPQLNQITAGQYSVSVTDANGCQTIAHATLLSQYPAMTAAIWVGNMPASGVFCTNEPIFVKGQYNNTPHKINWLLPNAQPASATTDTVTLQFAQPGNYTITLIAADLYTTDTATLTIKVAAAPEIVFQTRAAHLNQFDGQIMALVSEGMPPYGYKWSTGLEDANTITGLNFGNYSLTVTDGSGCPVVRSITLGVAIDNPLQMQVYSHTGNRLLQIYNANPENVPANLQLYAVTGQLVWQGNISANTAFSLNMAAFLPQGLYFAVLQANGYIVVEKIFCGE